MSRELQRLTTEYIPTEDRIRLSGELAPDRPLVIWLTQRLVYRLVPPLLKWLDEQVEKSPVVALQPAATDRAGRAGIKDFLQESAQQTAQKAVTPQPPVRARAGSPNWLAHAVDLNAANQGLKLTLRGEGVLPTDAAAEQAVYLALNAQSLRQWLHILQRGTLQAGWSQEPWPPWMQTGSTTTEPPKEALLH